MAAGMYKDLLDLLESLPANLETWNQDRYSLNEAIIERHLQNINDHIDQVSLIYSDIQNQNNDNNQLLLTLFKREKNENRIGQHNKNIHSVQRGLIPPF